MLIEKQHWLSSTENYLTWMTSIDKLKKKTFTISTIDIKTLTNVNKKIIKIKKGN